MRLLHHIYGALYFLSRETHRDQVTPLHVAAMNGHASAVDALLEHGADISAVNKCVYCVPLSIVVTSGRCSTFADALMHNAGTTTLHFTLLHSGAILSLSMRCLLPMPTSVLETCKCASVHVALVAAALQDVKVTPMLLADMDILRYILWSILNRMPKVASLRFLMQAQTLQLWTITWPPHCTISQ